MIRNRRGQTLVLTVITLPLFMILAGLGLRVGKTLVVHQHVQSHCDYVVLEALRIQAQALNNLGQINLPAREIIDARRVIDEAIAASIFAPIFEPELFEARQALKNAQKTIEGRQKQIIAKASFDTQLFIHKESQPTQGQKVLWSFSAVNPVQGSELGFTLPSLNVKKSFGYEGETGAPLTLSQPSNNLQMYQGQAIIDTERFLPKWTGLSEMPHMKVKCQAKIKMTELEGAWTVILTNISNAAANLLSKRL